MVLQEKRWKLQKTENYEKFASISSCRQVDKYILKKEQKGIMCVFDNHYTTPTSKDNLI